MPLDYGLIGQASKPSGYDPLQSIARGQVIAAQQQKQQAAQAEAQRQQMIAQVVQQFPEDPDAAVRFLKSRDWEAAAFLEKQLTEHRTKLAEQRGKELDNEVKQGTINKARADAERAALQSKALDDWARFYDSDPEEAEHAARIVLGPDKWMTFKGQMEQRAETARHNTATEASTLSGQQVTMRGQDMTAATAAANRATTERGQNMTAQTAANRLAFDKSEAGKPSATTASGKPDVNAIINQIDTLSQRINTSEGGPMSNVTAWIRKGKAAANMDNDVNEYETLITGMIPMVARAVGHTGVLTQQDVDSVRNLFPKVGDNAQLAKNKMARVRSLLNSGAAQATTAAPAPAGSPDSFKVGGFSVKVKQK